jgi:hypothetical protein
MHHQVRPLTGNWTLLHHSRSSNLPSLPGQPYKISWTSLNRFARSFSFHAFRRSLSTSGSSAPGPFAAYFAAHCKIARSPNYTGLHKTSYAVTECRAPRNRERLRWFPELGVGFPRRAPPGNGSYMVGTIYSLPLGSKVFGESSADHGTEEASSLESCTLPETRRPATTSHQESALRSPHNCCLEPTACGTLATRQNSPALARRGSTARYAHRNPCDLIC